MRNAEKTNIKQDNKILKIGGLIILVFATQLFSMFIYERYIQRSIMQRIIDKQHTLRLLVEEYKQKNILPKTLISDEELERWRKIDNISDDPSAAYKHLISMMEEALKEMHSCSQEAKMEVEGELKNAKRNKQELIQFFKQIKTILTS